MMAINIDTNPDAMEKMADTILDIAREIITDCKNLDDVRDRLKSGLDRETYSRINNLLSQIAPHVQNAVVNVKTIVPNMRNYAAKVRDAQNAANG